MRNVTVGRTVAAPRSEVWAVLADYPNISDWNEAMENSYAIGDTTEGVGAERRCEFGEKRSIRMRETVTEWVPEERMVLIVDQTEKQLLKRATMTFTLTEAGETTSFTMSFDYEGKGGPLIHIYGFLHDRLLRKGFNAFIDNIETTARSRIAS